MKLRMETAPENRVQGGSRDAWLCVLALVLCDFIITTWLRIGAHASSRLSHWFDTPLGLGFKVVVIGGLWLFWALWFSRVATVRDFIVQVGLKQRLTLSGWCAAWLAIGIGLVDGYGTSRGWSASSQQPHPLGYDFVGAGWWFFALKAVVIMPFVEEVVTRGFLYRAFRSNYTSLVSTLLIVCFSACFHWGSVSRSLFTLLCLGSLSGLLCAVRERTGSLWNCLLGHAVFNAFAIHLWLPSMVGMLLLLALVAPESIHRWQAARAKEPNNSA